MCEGKSCSIYNGSSSSGSSYSGWLEVVHFSFAFTASSCFFTAGSRIKINTLFFFLSLIARVSSRVFCFRCRMERLHFMYYPKSLCAFCHEPRVCSLPHNRVQVLTFLLNLMSPFELPPHVWRGKETDGEAHSWEVV